MRLYVCVDYMHKITRIRNSNVKVSCGRNSNRVGDSGCGRPQTDASYYMFLGSAVTKSGPVSISSVVEVNDSMSPSFV